MLDLLLYSCLLAMGWGFGCNGWPCNCVTCPTCSACGSSVPSTQYQVDVVYEPAATNCGGSTNCDSMTGTYIVTCTATACRWELADISAGGDCFDTVRLEFVWLTLSSTLQYNVSFLLSGSVQNTFRVTSGTRDCQQTLQNLGVCGTPGGPFTGGVCDCTGFEGDAIELTVTPL